MVLMELEAFLYTGVNLKPFGRPVVDLSRFIFAKDSSDVPGYCDLDFGPQAHFLVKGSAKEWSLLIQNKVRNSDGL